MCYESGIPERYLQIQRDGLDIVSKSDSNEYQDNLEALNKITMEKMLKGPFTIIIFLSILVIINSLIHLSIHKFCQTMTKISASTTIWS